MALRQLVSHQAHEIHELAMDLALQLDVTPRKAGQVLATLGHTVDLSRLLRRRARVSSAEPRLHTEDPRTDDSDDGPGENDLLVEVSEQAPPLLLKKLIKDLLTLGM